MYIFTSGDEECIAEEGRQTIEECVDSSNVIVVVGEHVLNKTIELTHNVDIIGKNGTVIGKRVTLLKSTNMSS